MSEEDLRNGFAFMLAAGFAIKGEINPKAIWEIADMLVEERKQKEKEDEEDTGIVAVVPKRTRKR